jgi:hypothetical protein
MSVTSYADNGPELFASGGAPSADGLSRVELYFPANDKRTRLDPHTKRLTHWVSQRLESWCCDKPPQEGKNNFFT